MRDNSREIPEDFDDFSKVMTIVASKVVNVSNGMSSSFIYESAKDVLRWHNLSIRKHINTVMRIGTLLNLSDEDWTKVKYSTTSKMLDGDDIDRMAVAMQR